MGVQCVPGKLICGCHIGLRKRTDCSRVNRRWSKAEIATYPIGAGSQLAQLRLLVVATRQSAVLPVAIDTGIVCATPSSRGGLNRTEFEFMKYLLLIAHGSRRQSANDEIRQLGGRIAALEGNDFDGVVTAFLEMAEPDIHQGVTRCVELGASQIVVVPYFLAGGNHVSKDIPAEIACARAGLPQQVEIEISQYLGASAAMASLVLDCSRHGA